MARLIGPDEGSRTVYLRNGLIKAQGRPITLYADAAKTTLANVLTFGGAAIPGSVVTIDASSKIPLIQFPDGVDTIWAAVGTGPATPLYARVDDRLDALTTMVSGNSPAPPLLSGQWRATPGPTITNYSVPNGVERAQLMFLPPNRQLQAIACWVTVTVAATNVRFGIRADSDNQASTLLLDAGTVPANGGIATLPITFTVPDGPVSGVPLWLSVTPQGGAVTFVSCLANSEYRDATTATSAIGFRSSQQQGSGAILGALPGTFGPSTSNLSTAVAVAVQGA